MDEKGWDVSSRSTKHAHLNDTAMARVRRVVHHSVVNPRGC
jgi:hypothetical protein